MLQILSIIGRCFSIGCGHALPRILFSTLLLLTSLSSLDSEEALARPQVILIVVDRLAWEDLTSADLPNVRELMRRGAIGLMNVRSGGRQVPEDTYISIGASARAIGSEGTGLAFDVNAVYEGRVVGRVYEGRTGLRSPSMGIVDLGIASTIRENSELPQSIHIGALGDAIRGAGRRTAVLGNSDCGGRFRRYGVSIAMDSAGYVDMGNVEDLLIKDSSAPGGVRVDVKRLLDELEDVRDEADLIVVEFGDLFRLEEESHAFTDEMIEVHRARGLRALDDLLGGVLPLLHEEGGVAGGSDDKGITIILLSPTAPSSPLKRGSQLTPVIIAGHEGERGLLRSPGTRWKGLVTNTAIAPTILRYLDIPAPKYMSALPVDTVSASDPVGTLNEMDERIEWVNSYRSFLLRAYILIAIILHLGSLPIILMPLKSSEFLSPLFQRGLLFLASLPLALLLLPLWGPRGFIATLFIPILFAFIISSLAPIVGTLLFGSRGKARSRGLRAMAVIAMGSAILVMIDVTTGYSLIRYSPLGYDPVTGARFYGIGNEYMGILVGASLVGFFSLLELFRPSRSLNRLILIPFSLGVTAVIGHPSLGANAGGTITAMAGFGLGWLLLEFSSITIWHILGLAIAIGGALGALAIVDYLRGSTSHIGGAIKTLFTSGTEEIYNIIWRKLSMNLKLFRWSLWSRVLLVALGALVLLFYRPPDLLKRIVKRYTFLSKGLLAAIIASIVAAAVNDSGVVAAATCVLFASSALLILALEDRGHGDESPR